jgi:hypothetical protein
MKLTADDIDVMREVLRKHWEGAGHTPEAPIALCDLALKGLQAEARWIPVSERLPNSYERVLVWFLDHDLPHVRFGSIASGHWRPEGGNGNFDDVVTHWMPLPAAPNLEQALNERKET